jgi:telomere length regulation protein
LETNDLNHEDNIMDDFLTPVSTTKVNRTPITRPLLQEHQTTASKGVRSAVNSPDEALKALREEPDFDTVCEVLKYLTTESDKKNGFNLIKPDPISANIAYQLVNTTIPDYWQPLKESKIPEKQLLRCLRNPCGIGAILARLRPLVADCRQKKPVGQMRDASSQVEELLDVLQDVLHDEKTSSYVWADVQTHAKDAGQAKMMWKEYTTQIASGKIISLAAEAEDVLRERKTARKPTWLSTGSEYASWLGRNIAALMTGSDKGEDFSSAVVDLCGKALSLGYTSKFSDFFAQHALC